MSEFIKKLARGIRIELHEEFDKNFERKAFFDKAWQKRRREGRGSLLVASGRLRRGLRSTSNAKDIHFAHDAPYAKIHNEGGKIKITPKMRKFFWAMYYKNMQGVAFNVKTKAASNKSSARKNELAEGWRNMAMSKKGVINIPKRQYVGAHSRVDEIIERRTTQEVEKYLNNLDKQFKR